MIECDQSLWEEALQLEAMAVDADEREAFFGAAAESADLEYLVSLGCCDDAMEDVALPPRDHLGRWLGAVMYKVGDSVSSADRVTP